ncbi:MAG: hypothetical protein PHU14_07295 [Methylovulum sp.]|nr:hypothetical protein [Methylovulum sp.]
MTGTASKALILSLGMAMLGIGIIGPDKLFSGEAQATDNAETEDSQAPWFFKITGDYQGVIASAKTRHPIKTTFSVSKVNKITGAYVIEEGDRTRAGELVKAEIAGPNTLQFQWHDEDGNGTVRIIFSEDLAHFSGNWGNDTNLDLGNGWDGEKE